MSGGIELLPKQFPAPTSSSGPISTQGPTTAIYSARGELTGQSPAASSTLSAANARVLDPEHNPFGVEVSAAAIPREEPTAIAQATEKPASSSPVEDKNNSDWRSTYGKASFRPLCRVA